MGLFRLAWIVLLAGTLHAENAIRVLSADPADNVLLEISTDTPQAVMSGSDLTTWKYVFPYLPPCQNFKAYAPQIARNQTFFKLAPVHPSYQSLVLDDEIPSLEGKRFLTLGIEFSFSAGGRGTLNYPNFEGGGYENLSYSILDSRPGMISGRTWIEDGHKLDYFIVVRDPTSAPHQLDKAVMHIADRFGDLRSESWAGSFGIFPEVPPAPVTWPNPVGMVVEFEQPHEVVTLGPNGIASMVAGGITETGTYDYVATGQNRATLQLLRSDGSRITAFVRPDGSQAPYRAAGVAPYVVSGNVGVRFVSYPGEP